MIPIAAALLILQGITKLIRDVLILLGKDVAAGPKPEGGDSL
jgi:TRAP-type mannitol/chloroaromatic compound transport system permease small subunit